MNEKTPPPKWSQIPSPTSPSAQTGTPRFCLPFDLSRFDKQFMIDGLWRWGAIGMVVIAMLVFQSGISAANAWLVMLPVLGVWVAISLPGVKVVPLLGQIAGLLESDPAAVEPLIAVSLERQPLPRHLRMQLYYYLALLRHSQTRFDESTAIANALLSMRLGQAERYRAQLLLLVVEARLLKNDLAGAYPALTELSRRKLTLVESLQHLSLRTRYEVACGYDGQALVSLPEKIEMAQMMPAGQCGTMHAILAIAAQRQGDVRLSDWLQKRAALLCDPAQFEAFSKGHMRVPMERPLTQLI